MQTSRATVPTTVRRLVLAAAMMALASATAAAQSRVDLSTENVTVDLSVIGESGGGLPSGAAATSPMVGRAGGGLLMPGPSNPTSRLHVAVPYGPDGGIKLRPPSAAPKKRAKSATTARKPAPAKARAPKKPAEPPVAATEPPAPLTAPPPAPAVVAQPVAPVATVPPAAKPEAPPPAAAPAKKEETAAAATPAKAEQASKPPAAAAKEAGAVRVVFPPEVSKLPNEAKDGLALLSKKIKDNENVRLQLMAYAGGKDLPASKARRLSLSRALSVRSYLIENGIRSTRIDVRALGDKATDEPVDRVDVTIVER